MAGPEHFLLVLEFHESLLLFIFDTKSGSGRTQFLHQNVGHRDRFGSEAADLDCGLRGFFLHSVSEVIRVLFDPVI